MSKNKILRVLCEHNILDWHGRNDEGLIQYRLNLCMLLTWLIGISLYVFGLLYPWFMGTPPKELGCVDAFIFVVVFVSYLILALLVWTKVILYWLPKLIGIVFDSLGKLCSKLSANIIFTQDKEE